MGSVGFTLYEKLNFPLRFTLENVNKKLQIHFHLLNKLLEKNFIFAVLQTYRNCFLQSERSFLKCEI